MTLRPFVLGLSLLVALPFIGCGTTAREQREETLKHQQKSDEAAKDGAYGVAADEQRKAADSHHKTVIKSIDEGKPIPEQPKPGDKPADATTK